jgi:hypothetical protein
MNSSRYQSMTEDQSRALMAIMFAESSNKALLDKDYNEVLGTQDFICQVIEKRVAAFKLPKFEPSAVIMLSILVQGNPGKAVIGMVETMEKFEEIKPDKINAQFIAEHVYPWGFYLDSAWENVWDTRKMADRATGYNKLI